MNFQEVLNKSLQAHAQSIAIEDKGQQVSYQQLLNKSNQISRFLLSQDLGPEAQVGIVLDDRADLIASMTGIANARAVFVPLDPKMPEARMEGIVSDLDLKMILCSEATALPAALAAIPACPVEGIFKSDPAQAIDLPAFAGEDSLYIYFTSGSTGQPKGIIGKNASLLQFLRWETSEFAVKAGDRFSQFISPYFDAFLRDVYAPLLSGGTICVPPAEEDFFTSEKMTAWIDSQQINFIHCVPSLFRVFNQPGLSDTQFASLSHVLMSGEKINPANLQNWYDTFGGRIQLVNFYGTTEATMIRSFYRIQPEDAQAGKIAIGAPIADTELLIANKDMQACKPLIPGDLYIVSDYLSKGYLKRPELNAERFVRLSLDGLERSAFRTGDKARLMPNGKIELIGREDRQVKLRGIRVELDEVEQALNTIKGIKQGLVIKKEADNGEENLSAYLLMEEGATLRDEALRTGLLKRLPEYMLPTEYITLKQFPLLSNGKTDYAALAKIQSRTTIIAPQNPTEEKVLAIWKEILGDKTISTDDSFIAIGGNSLSIMRLIGRIYKEFKVRITLNQLFKHLSIIAQASFIKQATQDTILQIKPAEPANSYVLSAAQERMHFSQQINPGTLAYNLPVAWELSGDFDLARAEAAVQELIARHESLRTVFTFDGKSYSQEIRDSASLRIEVYETSDEGRAAVQENFVRSFDLTEAPLMRIGLMKSPSGNILLMDMHHIISDGMTQINLFAEFLKLYLGEELPELGIQYKDYAVWEAAFRNSDYYISMREFWLSRFEGDFSPLELPQNPDYNPEERPASVTISTLERSVFNDLSERLREQNITEFSLFYSVFQLLLSQLTGQDDITIGINSTGRLQEELAPVTGMFAKTLPVRHKVDYQQSFMDYVATMHKQLVDSNSMQLYDLADIIRDINQDRAQPIKDLIQVMFVYQNFMEEIISTGELSFRPYNLEQEEAKYPLTFFVYEHLGIMEFRLEHQRACLSDEAALQQAEQYTQLIRTIVAKPDLPMSEYLETGMPEIEAEDSFDFNF